MEILGYELAPDFHYAKGNYGADYVLFKDGDGPSSLIYSKVNMSPEEIARFNATSPSIDKRYHYRYLAVKHGSDAAALVPPRSQAYRAILCHAAAWARGSELKDDLYRTYVRRGSSVSYTHLFPAGFFPSSQCRVERAHEWGLCIRAGAPLASHSLKNGHLPRCV